MLYKKEGVSVINIVSSTTFVYFGHIIKSLWSTEREKKEIFQIQRANVFMLKIKRGHVAALMTKFNFLVDIQA